MAEETVLSEDEKLAAEEAAKVAAEKEAEDNVYKQELAKLQAEKEQAEADKLKAEEIARQKNGTITEEREKRKSAEAAAKALAENQISDEDLDKKLEAKLNAREFQQRLKTVSENADEQKLILHHYETSIVKTGNVETDLARAVAIANAHLIDQAKQAQVDRGGYAEVKRMFVAPAGRGRGTGRLLLADIVRRAREAGLSALMLETGIHQPEAIGLYERDGFALRGPFGDYQPDPLSIFMERAL